MNLLNDITINNRIEAYLSNYEQLPYGIGIIKNDATCTLVDANSTFYRLIGHTKEEFLEHHGNRMTDIILDHFREAIKKHEINEDYDFEWDLRIRCHDESIVWIHDCAHYDASLDVFFVLFIDITNKMITSSRHLSYDAYHTRNAILTFLSKYATEQIIVTDYENDEVIYMNHASMDLLGFQQEEDWHGKSYTEVVFGSLENVPPGHHEPITQNGFSSREYYNPYHKMYSHVESKTIEIPTINRTMILHIITDISAQKQLENEIMLQKTLHKCVETLFTTTTMNCVPESAFYNVLNQLKKYYQSDGAFFYKFKNGSFDVEQIYEVAMNNEKRSNHILPMTLTDAQVEAIQALSKSTPMQNQVIIDSFGEKYKTFLMNLHAQYNISTFSCVTVSNVEGQILAFMGVTNPRFNEDNKELMELLSRFICMFIEHQQDQKVKQEAIRLEEISKTNVLEKCAKNFQKLKHHKLNIDSTLNDLCYHYDAQFATVLTNNENGDYDFYYKGGQVMPDFEGLSKHADFIMDKWGKTLEKYTEYGSDAVLNAPLIKTQIQIDYGIDNFIVSPIQDSKGKVTGLVFVCNCNLSNRANLLVHVVAKNISDYLDKVIMHKRSNLEPLTKLANKITTQDSIKHCLKTGRKGVLFIIDIDHFKELNDTLGHQIGDQAIKDIATAIKKIFRTSDIVGRIGGDEFMIYCQGDISEEMLINKSNQILENSSLHYTKDNRSVSITASVGICRVDDTTIDFQTLYERVDKALYQSKRKGKNCYTIVN